MPEFLEKKLKRQYADLPEDERDNAVYGTMNKLGMMHGSKETDKGRRAQQKHDSAQGEALRRLVMRR